MKKPKKAQTNGSKANQWVFDPRQLTCWEYYIDRKSETYNNAYQSAIKAGYTPITAKQITSLPWFKQKMARLGRLLPKAELVLEEFLDISIDENTEPALIKIKQDTAKYITSTIGKDEGYSTRSEVTGKNGDALIPEPLLGGKSNGQDNHGNE